MQQVLEDVSREKESLELHLNEVSCRYGGGIHGMYMIVHLCTCKHVHVHVNTCKHVHLHVLHVYMYSVLYMCTHVYACIHVHFVYVHSTLYIFCSTTCVTYIYMYMYVYVGFTRVY